MRWLIGTLVVANLVLLLWWTTERNPALQPAALPQPDVGDLEILGRERTSDRTETSTAAAPEPASPPQPAAPPSPPPAPKPAPDVTKVAAHAEAQSRPAPKVAVPPPPPAPTPKAPKAVASAVPPKPASKPAPPTVAQRPKPAPRPAPRSRIAEACWELGPFEEEIRVRSLALPRGVRRLQVKHSRIRVPAGYYVLVPAQSSREQARAIARRLREKGVRDSWVFSSGPLKNAISLGMFSREENAQRRLEEIRRLGFPAELQQRHRSLEGYLVHVRGPDTPATRRLLEELTAGQMRPMRCPAQ